MSTTMSGSTTTAAGRSPGHVHPPLSLWSKILRRPEPGALAGAVAVFAFFAIVASDRGFLSEIGTRSYLQVAAEIGIIVVPVTLLMIAGEFDLSVGSMVAAAGVLYAYPVTEGWPEGFAILFTIGVAVLVGLTNGYLTLKTRLPSFIVTLAMLFLIRGVTIAVTGLLTNSTTVGPVPQEGGFLRSLLAGELLGLPASFYWWIGLVALATWVLTQTGFGNWVFGAGGDAQAARNVGVPVFRVKLTLFVFTAIAASLVALMQVIGSGSADVSRGNLMEFSAISAAVIGGTLLTGGYGSAIGGALGALIFGMVSQGIFYTGIDANWYQAILGAMLLAAALVNQIIRARFLRGAS